MAETLKAYVVTETCESTGGVVFARFHAEARRVGASRFGDGDRESVECRRAKEFDAYAPGPISPLVLIDHGWFMECMCGRRLDQDNIGEYPRAFSLGEILYCSPWCRLSSVEERGRETAKKKLGATMAALHLPSFCTVTSGHVFKDYVPKTRRSVEVLGAHFTFPGAEHGDGAWRSDRLGMVTVAQGDYDTFQKLKEDNPT